MYLSRMMQCIMRVPNLISNGTKLLHTISYTQRNQRKSRFRSVFKQVTEHRTRYTHKVTITKEYVRIARLCDVLRACRPFMIYWI